MSNDANQITIALQGLLPNASNELRNELRKNVSDQIAGKIKIAGFETLRNYAKGLSSDGSEIFTIKISNRRTLGGAILKQGEHTMIWLPIIRLDNYNRRVSVEADIYLSFEDGKSRSGHDIDNYLKTILDAIRMPRNPKEHSQTLTDSSELLSVLEDDCIVGKVCAQFKSSDNEHPNHSCIITVSWP